MSLCIRGISNPRDCIKGGRRGPQRKMRSELRLGIRRPSMTTLGILYIRHVGSIPGWRRSLGGGHGNPLQYSCLENHMDRGA